MLNPLDQKIRIVVESQTAGANAAVKSLEKVNKTFARLEKQLKRHTKVWGKQQKYLQKSIGTNRALQKTQARLNRSIRQSHQPLSKNINLLRRQRRELKANVGEASKLGKSLKSIGGLLAGAGLGYMALRRIKDVIDKRFNLALTGGVDQIKLIKQLTRGRNTTAAIDLASRFQQQSPYSRFSLGKDSLQGLIKSQRNLQGVGFDRANELILEITKSLEPQQLRKFLATAASGSIREAMLGAASGQNVGAITSALNALQINELAGTKRLDPMLSAAVRIEEATARLADAFDKLADKVAGTAQGMSNFQIALTAILAVVAGAGLKGLAMKGLGKGLNGIGRSAARSAGGAASKGAARAGGRVGTAISRRLAMQTIPRSLSLGMPVTGGVLGYGLPATAALASIYTAGKSAETAYEERKALNSLQGQMSNNRLFDVANKAKSTAIIPREKLAARRQELDALISSRAAGAGTQPEGFFAGISDFLGFMPELPEVDTKQLDKLREMRQRIHEQIREIDSTAMPGLDKTTKAAQNVSKATIDLENNLNTLQQQAAKRQELNITGQELASSSSLARAQLQMARMTPLGMVGATSESLQLQEELNREIENLNKLLANIDKSTSEGRAESNRIKTQIVGLRTEQKQNAVAMSRAYLDSIQAQAFNSGAFEKILVTQHQNIAAGLDSGMIQGPREWVGASGFEARQYNRKPFRVTASTNNEEVTSLKNIAREFNNLISIAANRPSFDFSEPEQDRPTARLNII